MPNRVRVTYEELTPFGVVCEAFLKPLLAEVHLSPKQRARIADSAVEAIRRRVALSAVTTIWKSSGDPAAKSVLAEALAIAEEIAPIVRG